MGIFLLPLINIKLIKEAFHLAIVTAGRAGKRFLYFAAKTACYILKVNRPFQADSSKMISFQSLGWVYLKYPWHVNISVCKMELA